jgi:hypothetical protein
MRKNEGHAGTREERRTNETGKIWNIQQKGKEGSTVLGLDIEMRK